jgi:hypothetical protein
MELNLADEFGAHLADGEVALRFRLERIEPYLALGHEVVLDFRGVRNANSSFINALLAASVELHGDQALQLLNFRGCNPLLRVLVEAAIDLGLQKRAGRVDA